MTSTAQPLGTSEKPERQAGAAGYPEGPLLSVIIITKNETRHIGACLDSVSFADEIIVLDSGSSDNTCEIARARGAQVHVSADWPGFGPQKNRVLDLATGQWVLAIDADERVTPELAAEIQRTLTAPTHNAYQIARLSTFDGRQMRHSGWWPDYVVRLFRRGTARFTDAAVHESVQSDTKPGTLRGHFLHYPFENIAALLQKVNRYSSDAAAMMYRRGKRTTVLGALGHGFWTFVRIYLIRRGFLDARQGLVVACAGAAGSFFRYAKLIELQQANR